jgi:hypothetical protein
MVSRIGVVPLAPSRELAPASTGESRASALALVSHYLAEALQSEGLSIISPTDIEAAWLAEGTPLPRGDARAVAALAARNFTATSVLLGELRRYRERSGGQAGSLRPSSVAFDVKLYSAPGGELLWQASFELTQPSFTSDPLRAIRLPGGGMRWLDAAEVARYGAAKVASSLSEGR